MNETCRKLVNSGRATPLTPLLSQTTITTPKKLATAQNLAGDDVLDELKEHVIHTLAIRDMSLMDIQTQLTDVLKGKPMNMPMLRSVVNQVK